MDRKRVLTSLALTAVFNTIIALFLTHLGFGGGFLINFIFSQCIGLCMCAFVLIGHYFVRGPSLPGHAILSLTGKGVVKLKDRSETLTVSNCYMHLFKQM